MTADLGLPVELVICPIVREPDGLAMSSRNRYLSAEERGQALVLHRALDAVEALVATGELSSEALIAAARANFATEPSVRVDYVAAVEWATLEPVKEVRPGTLIAVAAYVGTTRLIDNLVF
jgi:pantoate--beta-alanine ligase